MRANFFTDYNEAIFLVSPVGQLFLAVFCELLVNQLGEGTLLDLYSLVLSLVRCGVISLTLVCR